MLSTEMNKQLTHFDEKGNTRMVDVGGKTETLRIAVAPRTYNCPVRNTPINCRSKDEEG